MNNSMYLVRKINRREEQYYMISRTALYLENFEELHMGIKPSYVKNLGTELLAKQRDYFSGSFEENKLQLTKSAQISSKRVRNRIAGYITRKVNSKKRT